VVELEAALHKCQAIVDFDEENHPPYPATINDDTLYHHVKTVGRILLGAQNVHQDQTVMAGEDFAFYQEKIPGMMIGVGIRNEEIGAVYSPHSAHFFLDEDVLPVGAALHAVLAETYLNQHQTPTVL